MPPSNPDATEAMSFWEGVPIRSARVPLVGGLLALASLIAVGPSTARGQQPGAPDLTCSDCPIQLEYIVTLGGSERGEWVATSFSAQVARAGRYLFVASWEMSGEIGVFDHEGRFVRHMGREGLGPGEYRFIRSLWTGSGDSLYVFDAGNPRLTVLSPDLEVVRTVRLPGRLMDRGGLVLESGAVVINARTRGEGGLLPSVQVIDPADGRVLRPLGVEPGRTDEIRWLAPAGESAVWVARTDEYLIERWDVRTGALTNTIRRNPSWWSESEEPSPYPSTGLMGLRQDETGLLWVLGRYPDTEWEMAVEDTDESPEPGPGYRIVDGAGYWDAVLELVDPMTGALVESRTLPNNVVGFLDARHVFGFRETELGDGLIDVWRVHLRR